MDVDEVFFNEDNLVILTYSHPTTAGTSKIVGSMKHTGTTRLYYLVSFVTRTSSCVNHCDGSTTSTAIVLPSSHRPTAMTLRVHQGNGQRI